jgi:uncharacterized membrane protein YbhN (UPF0104 family)
MSPRTKVVLKRAIPIVFYTLLVGFLAYYITTIDWSVLTGIDVNWWLVAAATLVSLSFRYWGVMIWFFLLKRLGATGLRGRYLSLTFIYAKSWLGRYIPGAATWIVGKVYFASQHGVSRGRLAVSGLLEGALQIVATLGLAIGVLLIDSRTQGFGPWFTVLLVVALAACVAAIVPQVFEFLLNIALRIFRRPKVDRAIMPSGSTIVWSALMYLGGSVIAGVSYYLISAALYPAIEPADVIFIVGATSLASAVSMLAVFAPGGLGVREGVLALLLVLVVPAEIALVIVVVTRIWSVAVDGVFFVVAGASNLAFGRGGASEAPAESK